MSWIRGTESSAGSGNFDGEQIESPRGKWEADPDDERELSTTPKDDEPSTQEVIDKVWWQYVLSGADPRQLARKLKVDASTVYRAIARAQLKEKPRSPHVDPIVEPIFGVHVHTPTSPCAHPVPFPDGAREYCPGCHKTGVEGHPALQARPGDYVAPMITQYDPAAGTLGGTETKRRGPKPKSAAARKRQRATA